MGIITVGTGLSFDFQTIAEAVLASQSGDVINVQAGTYTNDFTHIDHSLTLQAVGGMVIMNATQDAPDGKAILTEGATSGGIDVKIDGFAFTNATAADANGAGIRYEGGTLTVTNCLFKGNQNGILAAPDPNGVILISRSEFDGNGVGGDGHTHNMYINNISSFTLTDSFTHDAIIGHEIKSRAANNTITNNRIFDNGSTSSYSIDLPNGGNATITGNIIEQGPAGQNPNMIAYGEEGNLHPGTSLSVSNNSFVNDRGSGPALWNDSAGTVADFTNNTVFGFTGPLVSGLANESGTVVAGTRPTLDQSSPVCYVKGTHIATPAGESKIEDLHPGDLILILEGGNQVARAVKWIGWRRLDLAKHRRPATVAPVCIERGAFADNMPHRDLHLSPDHAVFVDGKLICARQLVNGTTIRRETGCNSVDYFHIELDEHAVILAEGLPAESYLNTGNRSFFMNSGVPLLLHPDLMTQGRHRAREVASCVPFVCDEDNVLPVWRRLAERSAALGRAVRTPPTDVDPELRIIGNGQTLHSCGGAAGHHIFLIPKGITAVRILSRAGTLTDFQPWQNDGRRLGVHVERIALRDTGSMREISLDDPGLLRGWWAAEKNGDALGRWTNGDAELPLPVLEGPAFLELRASIGGMRYVSEGEEGRGSEAAVSGAALHTGLQALPV